MYFWETIIFFLIAVAILVISSRRRRYVLVPTTRNKTLAIAWIVSGFLLPAFLLLLDSRGRELPVEILLALHLLCPWFVLSPKENHAVENPNGSLGEN